VDYKCENTCHCHWKRAMWIQYEA